jgi:undecaprenyl-diphosphatase
MRILDGLLAFDRSLLLRLREVDRGFPTAARWISRSADGPLYLLLGLALAATLESGPFLLKHLALGFAVERPLYWVLKNTLRRRRPAESVPEFRSWIQAADEFSFPSGHTCAAFLFVTLLTLHLGPWLLVAYAWAAMVGVSRVQLGVHFPSDVLVGSLIGTSMGLVLFGFEVGF